MPQKRAEVIEKVDVSQLIPDVYENWLKKQVKARLEDGEEEDVERSEDIHEKAHRRKRGKISH